MSKTLILNIESINISIEGMCLRQASPQDNDTALLSERLTDSMRTEAPAEYTDWEKRVWRRGYDEAQSSEDANRSSQTREYRSLGNGEKITQKEALAELATLAADGWRLETPQELFAQVDYGHKNQNGAYSRDESLKDAYYWTSQETPWYEGGRVVVGFYGGDVDGGDLCRALARAVRVSGQ